MTLRYCIKVNEIFITPAYLIGRKLYAAIDIIKGKDSEGLAQTAFKNPKTGKWKGGHPSSQNEKYHL